LTKLLKKLLSIKHILKLFNRNLCVILASHFSPKYRIINILFNWCKKNSHDSLFFMNYEDKKKLIKFFNEEFKIKKNTLYKDFEEIQVDNNMHSVLNDLNNQGISEKIKYEISNEEAKNFVNDLEVSDYYDSHVPYLSNKKNFKISPDGAYKSYDYETQLNNPTLLKICTDEKIIKIANNYLGSIPKIYSINTFTTLPGKKAFTHDFHRDIDNLKWLVVFIYWTGTSRDDGAYEQIKYTHKPSDKLNELLNTDNKIFSNNFDNFFKKTVPGYGKNENYKKLFNSEIINVSGEPGKMVMCDTLGLHRGTNVQNVRNVTWIRYGVMSSRQKILKNEETLSDPIKLNKNSMDIINNSKFKHVLSDIVSI
jgi:hypothetical protein